MAYSDPNSTHNPATGNIAPASWGDAVNAAIAYVAAGKPRCKVFESSSQSITTATFTALTSNEERYDIGGCHSTSVNTTRLTVPTGEGGLYFCSAQATFPANATGSRFLGIRVNGSGYIAAFRTLNLGGATTVEMNVSCDYLLAAADYIECVVYQDSGSSLSVGNQEWSFRWVATTS